MGDNGGERRGVRSASDVDAKSRAHAAARDGSIPAPSVRPVPPAAAAAAAAVAR